MIHRSRTLPSAFAAVAVVLLVVGGCDRGTPDGAGAVPAVATEGDQTLRIGFKTLGAAAKGDNRIEAVVQRTDGTPVTDATVTATFRMPAMPQMNMPEMHSTTPLTHEADGRYVGTGQLEMAGTWNVTVTVSRGGEPLASSRFTVFAK